MDHHIVMLRLSKVLMNGALSVLQHEAGASARFAMQRDAARIALDLRDTFAAAVLGASKGSDEVWIHQYAAAAGVDAIISAVREVMNFLWLVEQADDEMDAVDADIGQRTAAPLRAEHIGHAAAEVLRVTAGILREIALDDLDLSYAGKQIADGVIVGHMLRDDGLEQKALLLLSELKERPCLRGCHRKGLLADHMLSCAQRFFRMLGMKRIGRCDVDDIGIGSQHLIQIGVDGTDAMALCQRKRMIARAGIHACAADPLQLFDSLQEQIRDEACSDGNDV